ncbi:MAG: ATP-binding cassette domain-containing protein [Bradyrhizobium sp.]|uniref:ATP-binding cassette domain-containing protein n=1 Tax=Bradyrhizobium sp. TaxID=376 RepID=UPI003D0AB740
MSAPLLRVEGIVKRFTSRRETTTAVNDVGFTLQAGRTLGIVGESGSGKSTLARIVAGLIAPDAGAVHLGDSSVTQASRRELRSLRRRMQFVFQDPASSLDPRQSVGATIEEVLTVHGIGSRADRRRRAAEMLSLVGLPSEAARRFPHEFSGGQRQRIAIARALVIEPELLICDEPVSALDVSVQAQVLDLLMQLKSRMRLTMLFISHDLSVVAHVSDEVAVMRTGHLVESGPASEVLTKPEHPYTQELLASVPRLPREDSLHSLPQI